MIQTLEADETEAALCQRSFRLYVARAWREIDPAPFVPAYHIDAICDHLQALAEGHLQKLIINVPPGTAKSMLCSVLWPTWVWARKPEWQLLGASYEVGLATRDAVKARELMRGDWYTRHFRTEGLLCKQSWDFAGDQDLKQHYKNTKRGLRQALGVGGKGTGYRGDALLIDDPVSALDAHSKNARETAIRWKDETMSSRFNNKAKATELLIMQRLHENDLTGHLLEKGGWEHLCLPAEFEPSRRCKTSLPWTDTRKEEGELLFPALFSKDVLTKLKKDVGSYGYAGQYQQRPAPAAGGVLQREWFSRRWMLPGQKPIQGLECRALPMQFDHISMWTDAAFKKTEDSDYVAIAVVGVKGPDCYLLQLTWEQMTFTGTVAALVDVRNKWASKGLAGVYVEDKANGTAVMDVLKGKIPGLIPVEPEGGKEARIHACSPFIEAGNLWLPLHAPWVDDYITEASAFPKAPHDDAIDCTAYFLNFYGKRKVGILEAMAYV